MGACESQTRQLNGNQTRRNRPSFSAENLDEDIFLCMAGSKKFMNIKVKDPKKNEISTENSNKNFDEGQESPKRMSYLSPQPIRQVNKKPVSQ